jgi:hypothetical protein
MNVLMLAVAFTVAALVCAVCLVMLLSWLEDEPWIQDDPNTEEDQ